MDFSYLTNAHQAWKQVLVIGRTIEREGKRYHIVGMTLNTEDTAFLYILEPFSEPARPKRRGAKNHRTSLKDQENGNSTYLDCRALRLGKRLLGAQGGQGGPLRFSTDDYQTIELFFRMIDAGWTVPDWLRETEWEDLSLTTLYFSGVKRLPKYTKETPLTLIHRDPPRRHILEKTVALTIGKSRSFSFTDHNGEEVWCHINKVSLIDVWEDTARQFEDPRYTKKVTPGQLQEIKEHTRQALSESCPKGMCYIGIEYECSKDYQLQFYAKEYLSSRPKASSGSASFLLMRLKPDKKTGTHGLPLRGAVIDTPFAPDTVKIPAELFLYYEKPVDWEEQI